ncbi:MAG: M56 family metallopeptidase [Gemmatimonadota bacterium]
MVLQGMGWGLVHTLWIGSLLALLTGGALRSLRRSPAWARYGVAFSGLLLVAALPIQLATFITLKYVEHENWVTRSVTELLVEQSDGDHSRAITGAGNAAQVRSTVKARHDAMYPPLLSARTARWIGIGLVGIAGLWICLAGLFFARIAADVISLRRTTSLLANGRAERRWRTEFEALRGRMRLSVPVRLAVSPRVDVPIVVGLIRPVVLIPASTQSAVGNDHLEAILAHELGHVRRWDLVMNLVQRCAEATLFFHPATKWLSRWIAEERECSTDALACRFISGSPGDYLRALAAVENKRLSPHRLALGVDGGDLLRRARRLKEMGRGSRMWTVAASGSLLVGLVAAAFLANWSPPVRASVEAVMQHGLQIASLF